MQAWWDNLNGLNQGFYTAAIFFSVFFVWQLIAAFIGLGGDDDIGGDDLDGADADGADLDADHSYAEGDSAASILAFKLLSVRSIITFFTLFTWGGALYLNGGVAVSVALGFSALWGLTGMVVVALIFSLMRKLTQVGTANMDTCIGTCGAVYLNIPEGGVGEVKVLVGGVFTHVKARSVGGKALAGGTRVRVTRLLGGSTVEVAPEDEAVKEEA